LITKNAEELLRKRYCINKEEPIDVYKGTAKRLAGGDEKFSDRLFSLFHNGVLLPNSPALFNSRNEYPMYHACCALGIEDNMESIADYQYRMIMMFKHSAGVGANYSRLRPKDAPLSNGGTSSGVMNLLHVINEQINYVKQGGRRRGAAMSLLWYYHPEIMDFVQHKLKGGLTNMNLSVMVDNVFMNAVLNKRDIELRFGDKVYGRIPASNLMDVIAFCAWASGCPGIVFFDRINKDNPYYPDMAIDTTNPCSESPIPQNSLCTLGSINLSKFVRKGEFQFEQFSEVVKDGVRMLLAMNKTGWYPFPEMKESMDKYNPIGLGIMGFADCLIKLGIYYDSADALDFIDQVGAHYKHYSNEAAAGQNCLYKRIIAPTGSLSILADCSSSVEPVFDDVFTRNLTVGQIVETRDIYKSQYVRRAHEISPEWHLKVQAQWQHWVDGGISKTINLPSNATVQDVRDVYIRAWQEGVKGVTVYRDLSKTEQVLYRKPTCSDEECYL